MKKYGLSLLLFLVLLSLTYFFVFKECDFNLLFLTLKNANIVFILLAFLSLLFYIFWGCLFLKRIFTYFKIKTKNSHILGYFATETYYSAITPSYIGGQPVAMYEMNKRKIPYEVSSIIVLFNSMFNRIALIFLALIFLMIFNKSLFGLNAFYKWTVILGILTTIMVILVFGALIYSKIVANFILKISTLLINHLKFIKDKEKVINTITKAIAEYQNKSKITKENPRLVIESFIIMLLQRISLLFISYFIYRSLGLNEYSVFLIMAYGICISLGSDLFPTPGGVMINESLLLIVNKFLYGSDLALSGMLLTRSFNFYLLVVLSGLYYLYFHLDGKKLKNKEREIL